MRRKIAMPVVLASTIVGCAQLPTDISRSTAAERPRDWTPNRDPNRRYDGPPSDIDRRRMEREPSAFSYCEKYKSDTAKHVLACTYGIEEAQRMAQGFAGGHGREDGYLRGYAWGMNKMERYVENSPEEMAIGEQGADQLFAQYASRAATEGTTPGARDGASLGAEEAKGRFYSAVDSKKMPSTDVVIPGTSYQGVPNAYYSLVGSIPRAEDYFRRSQSQRRLRVYDNQDPWMRHRDHQERGPKDIWNNEGRYDGESKRWLDGSYAFDMWSSMPGPGRQKYDMLKLVSSTGHKVKGRLPAQERPNPGPRPTNGPGPGPGPRPTNGPGPVPTPTPTTTPAPTSTPVPTPPSQTATPTPTPTPVVVDYQAIFKDAFVSAYNYFGEYYYTRGYYSMIDDGQRDGEQVGYEIGSDIARKKGLARGFDQRYQAASRNAYIQAFGQNYRSSFASTYDYYKNNSILSLNFMGIMGLEEDGVVQPGEDFAVKFKVVNVGGKATDLKYSVTGDVSDPLTLTDAISGISSKIITSPAIGQIDNRLDDGSSAKVSLQVNGMTEQMWQKIQRPVEFYDYKADYSMLAGSGLYTITLVNVATVPLNGKMTLELVIAGKVTKTVVASSMNAGEKKTYALDFSGIDPLTWITTSIPVQIVLKYNDMIFGQKAFNLSGNYDVSSVATYYDQLINDKGVVPAGKNVDDRSNEVRGILLDLNRREVERNVDASGNVYRTDANTTVPGKILAAKLARSEQSNRALSLYSGLTDAMSSEGKKFKSTLFIHPKRDAYYEILKQISGKKYK